MKKLFVYFENMAVGKKLMSGFGLVLILSIAVALCGIKSLDDIGDRAGKVRMLKILTDQFALAKDARLQYIKTHDEQFITANDRHLQEVEAQINELKQRHWSADKRSQLDSLTGYIATYRDKRAETVLETQKRSQIASALSVSKEREAVAGLSAAYAGQPEFAADRKSVV